MPRQKPNSGEHIVDILSRTSCIKHKVPKGIPCFHIRYDSVDKYGPAVCGSRVTKAGFVGQVQPTSLSKKAKVGESRSRR